MVREDEAMSDAVLVVAYDREWPQLFATVGSRLREVLGPVAMRINHIGSTAVPGLDAKPVIDVQVSVTALVPDDAFSRPLEGAGFVFRRENSELTKRVLP